MMRRWTVLGVLAFTLVLGVGIAFAMGLLNLPLIPVAVTHGPWLGGAVSTLDITLGSVPPGFDVSDGTYVGWCLEDNFLDDPPDGELYRLVDSTDDPVNFPSPCENYDQIPWDRVNYLLNHKNGTSWDVQLALWVVAGTAHPVYPRPMTQAALDMVADAQTNGDGFLAGPGDVVAVAVCADGIDVGLPGGLWQDTIFEVLFDGDGCTPGYWKQPHHFDSWPAAYAPGQYFDVVFGDGPHITLLQALKRNGGGENAFLRHATAALLNAASPEVIYPYSEDDVRALVEFAYTTGAFEDTKNLFATANEGWCPLN
jgi:hypothetical protein